MKRVAMLIALTLLSACGLRGPLERPPPLWGHPPAARDDDEQKRREREQQQQQPSASQTPGGIAPSSTTPNPQ
ncbi:MAG TPA: lipoprotein [Caulobacterales bacterium]|nr:lipoprotein [Caulobacterales bacterium]